MSSQVVFTLDRTKIDCVPNMTSTRNQNLYVTRFGKMSRKSPKVELRYGPWKSE